MKKHSLTIAFAFYAFAQFVHADKVNLFYDTSVPQIAFAADDIKAALVKRKHEVNIQALDQWNAESNGNSIVIANEKDQKLLPKAKGALIPQAYSISTTRDKMTTHWVFGGDANGTMYGGLQFAEHI
jgi:hypothetical protein